MTTITMEKKVEVNEKTIERALAEFDRVIEWQGVYVGDALARALMAVQAVPYGFGQSEVERWLRPLYNRIGYGTDPGRFRPIPRRDAIVAALSWAATQDLS